jgi:hypothetical protein
VGTEFCERFVKILGWLIKWQFGIHVGQDGGGGGRRASGGSFVGSSCSGRLVFFWVLFLGGMTGRSGAP